MNVLTHKMHQMRPFSVLQLISVHLTIIANLPTELGDRILELARAHVTKEKQLDPCAAVVAWNELSNVCEG